MRQVYISLPTTEKVQDFVETLSPLEGDFDLVSGKYILDAKSLMGIFTLDLDRPIQLNVYRDTAENMRALDRFMVKNGTDGAAAEAQDE
ncbi:HPr family phosphocarrier protein [Ruminococcaceae bacterium OttesenSCG-928-I18]|nr:HPr family phosphocarrier protein [Ruminococcaceae bacterium OttesenSCG-928-I18]